MCACPVPAETRERAGLVFGQVPADLHVPRVAGLLRRRLGDPGRTMGRGAGWGLEFGSAVRTEQRVAVAPRRHHARCGALPSQLLQGERNCPRDLKPDLLAASSRVPGGVRGAGNSRALGCLLVATRYPRTICAAVTTSRISGSRGIGLRKCGPGVSGHREGVEVGTHRGGWAAGRPS